MHDYLFGKNGREVFNKMPTAREGESQIGLELPAGLSAGMYLLQTTGDN
jgi:hypothetical protein